MKKLLLASFIMFGTVSFVSAQTADVNPAAVKAPAAPAKNSNPKKATTENDQKQLQGARTPSSSKAKTEAAVKAKQANTRATTNNATSIKPAAVKKS